MSIIHSLCDIVSSYYTVILSGFFITLFIIHWTNKRFVSKAGENSTLPPGEYGWPIIGALSVFAGKKTLLQHFLSLYEQHGTAVTSIRLAGKFIVCLNNYDVIREAMQMRELSDRGYLTLMKVDPDYRGVIHSSGSLWKEHRRFCLKTLRDFGMGRADGEILIKSELEHLTAHIAKHLNQPIDTGTLISPAINNTMCLFLFAKRYDYTDFTNFDRLRELDRLMMTIVPMWKPFVYSPVLMYLPGDVFGYKESRRRLRSFYDYIEEQINETRRGDDGSFISIFMNERSCQLDQGQTTTFTEDQLKHTIMDLFMAGTDTTTTFLRWSLLLLSTFPKLQTQLQREIYKHLGTRLASMKDKPNLHLVQAFIYEVHRFASISPIGLAHTCTQDIHIGGFFIPQGSSVLPNIYRVHRDETYWKYANEFNVENFLDDQGHVVHDQRLIPFSTGKRSCVGESLARMEIFLILTTLVQKYRFKLADNKTSLVGNLEGMNYPPPHKIIITERTVLNGPQTPGPNDIISQPRFPGNSDEKPLRENSDQKQNNDETTASPSLKLEKSTESIRVSEKVSETRETPEIFLNDERMERIKETLREKGRRPSMDICDLALKDFLRSGSVTKRKSCPDLNTFRS